MPSDAEYNERWLKIWSEGLPAGQAFDASKSAPALFKLLTSGQLDVRGKRALVPGCGRGYDVLLLAQHGADPAIGLEISSDAVKAAMDYKSQSGAAEDLASRALCKEGDFFKYEDGLFEIGYDYTFLCAMHPDMRDRWAEAWARQIKPGGELVTLMFPVDASMPRDQGPPFPLTPELYSELLSPHGFSRTCFDAVPKEQSHEGRQGKEFIARWIKA
ncbi:g2187 [Coccomyxa elongata]